MFDIAIIGAGPSGLFAAFEAGMLGLSAVVIDTLSFVGGQCTALYPEKPIYDIPAQPKILAKDLIDSLHHQAKRFNTEFVLNTRIEEVLKQEDGTFILKSPNTQIQAKTVIVAIGGGSFGPNRPPISNIELYEEKSVFYMVKSKEEFRGKDVIIAGGGDSAVDWAVFLADIASSVKVIHRRDKFRAHDHMLDQMHALIASGKIELLAPFQLESLNGHDGILESVGLLSIDETQRKTVNAQFLLPFFGLAMDSSVIKNWGMSVINGHIDVSPNSMTSSVSGIFSVGDISVYSGKLKLILCGFSEATRAVYSAREYINPGKSFHFEYSTSMKI